MPIVRVPADEDTFIKDTTPTSNYSTAQTIESEETIFVSKRGIIICNPLSMLGPNAVITNVTLKGRKKVSSVTYPHNLDLHLSTTPDVMGNQTTWNDRKSGTPWTSPGGDYNPVRFARWIITSGSPTTQPDWNVTTEFLNAYNSGQNLVLFLISSGQPDARLDIGSIENTYIPDRPYFEITYQIIDRTARLGKFTLGKAILGAGIKKNAQRENLGITEEEKVLMEIPLNELMGIIETVNGDMLINLIDGFNISEDKSYLTDYMAGVYAKITVLLDITKIDWCEMVLEGGQTITVNDEPARAFCFIKQSGQKFDHGIGIQPGDAVLFTCPLDPVIEVGDIVGFDMYYFQIISIINHYFDGNLIYRKAALQKRTTSTSTVSDMPQIGGFKASENEKGKTTLTWDDINRVMYPELDRYEVWESTVGGSGSSTITAISASTTQAIVTLSEAYSAGKYTIGGLVIISGSDDNDGSYIIAGYINSGGFGELIITTTKQMTTDTPLGEVFNATKFYLRDETKSNGLSVKNLNPNTIYYYIVRAIDKYGKAGPFSAETATRSNIGYKGEWNASTNDPTLSDATGIKGEYYTVSIPGTQDLGSGPITFDYYDRIIHNGTSWIKTNKVNIVPPATPTGVRNG